MEVTQVAPKREPDVLVRLTLEEAVLLRRILGGQSLNDVAVALCVSKDNTEAIKANQVGYALYRALTKLDY